MHYCLFNNIYNLSVLNETKKLSQIKPVCTRYLFILYLRKPTTKYNCRTIKLGRDFSNAIALVLRTFKLINHIIVFFDA